VAVERRACELFAQIVAANPRIKDIEDELDACETVLEGFRPDERGWWIHSSMLHLTAKEKPEAIVARCLAEVRAMKFAMVMLRRGQA